jgi:hypothetical protein
MNTRISRIVHIRKGTITINGELVMDDRENIVFGAFIRAAYKFAEISYPKFYKMDSPCKLALIAAELLLKNTGIVEKHGKDKVGIVIQNGSSTIDTDLEYQHTIDDRSNYFPSPAVFVYTLPNIMLGEICIRHKIFGENALLIEKSFDPAALTRTVDILFSQKRITACIEGWVEQHGDDLSLPG